MTAADKEKNFMIFMMENTPQQPFEFTNGTGGFSGKVARRQTALSPTISPLASPLTSPSPVPASPAIGGGTPLLGLTSSGTHKPLPTPPMPSASPNIGNPNYDDHSVRNLDYHRTFREFSDTCQASPQVPDRPSGLMNARRRIEIGTLRRENPWRDVQRCAHHVNCCFK